MRASLQIKLSYWMHLLEAQLSAWVAEMLIRRL
jgi:hypothetical protein